LYKFGKTKMQLLNNFWGSKICKRLEVP